MWRVCNLQPKTRFLRMLNNRVDEVNNQLRFLKGIRSVRFYPIPCLKVGNREWLVLPWLDLFRKQNLCMHIRFRFKICECRNLFMKMSQTTPKISCGNSWSIWRYKNCSFWGEMVVYIFFLLILFPCNRYVMKLIK